MPVVQRGGQSVYAPLADDEEGGGAEKDGGCGCRSTRMVWAMILITSFIQSMNGGVISIIIPAVAEEFDISTEIAAWVALAPSFASAMFSPSFGKLADVYGRAKAWWLGMLGICISNVVAGYAPSFSIMLVSRVVQGMAWGITGPAGFGLMAQGLDPATRGVASALQTATGTLGSSIGIGVGGIITQYLGWRWLFKLPIIPMFVGWLLSLFVLPCSEEPGTPKGSPTKKKKKDPFDTTGSVVFAAFIFCLLMAVNRGNDLGWSSPLVLGFGVATLVCLPILLLVERRAVAPVLPIKYIHDSIIVRCQSVSMLASLAYQVPQQPPVGSRAVPPSLESAELLVPWAGELHGPPGLPAAVPRPAGRRGRSYHLPPTRMWRHRRDGALSPHRQEARQPRQRH